MAAAARRAGIGTWVVSGGNGGQQPERGYQLGDLVEDLNSGEAWTVDDYYPGGPCHPAWVVLGRETREGGVVTDRSPEEIRLVTPVTERAIFPGDGWSDFVMLRQTGQTAAEFSGTLANRFGQTRAPQPAAPEPEAGPDEVEPGA